MSQRFLGQHGSHLCQSPAGAGARTGAAGAAWKRLVIEKKRDRPLHILSYLIISCHIFSYLNVTYRNISYHIVSYRVISCRILSCLIISYLIISDHIFISLYTQTGVKFEIGNIILICFWAEEDICFDARAQFQVPLDSHSVDSTWPVHSSMH